MVNVRVYQRLVMALLALALAGCQSPVSATQPLLTATVTALPVASSTSLPAIPTATLTPPTPTASPLPVTTSTPTLIPPGELTRSLLIETSANPGMDCYPEIDQHALWLAEPPYKLWAPFAPSEVDSRRSLHWSPSGARVAFIMESEAATRLGLADAVGATIDWVGPEFAVGRIADLCNHLSLGGWSSSEAWLTFDYSNYTGQFYRELYLLNTVTGAAQIVADDFYGFPPPTWSPQQDRFVYVGGTYNVDTHKLEKMSLKLVMADANDISVVELGAPADLDLKDRRDLVTALIWQSPDQLLMAVTPGVIELPSRLYGVDIATHTWTMLAQTPRESNDRSGQLALSPDGRWLAWANEDLYILDTASWKVTARLQKNWRYFGTFAWIIDSNARQLLVYSNDHALWQYAPESVANEVLLTEPSFIVDQGLFLAGAAWSP